MKNALTTVIAVVIAMTLSTTTALAGDCSTTAYANFQTSYPYQVTDVQGSGKPVLNGGVTWTRGNWRFDAFGSKDLSGKERFGNEVDLTAAYASSVMTPVGHVHYEALVSWWLLPDFGKVGDDLVQLQFDAARPFVLFSTTVSPYVRVTHLVGLGTYRDSDVGKTGVRFTIPLSPRWSLSGDGGVADDFSRAVVAKRFNGSVGFDAGNGFRLSAGVELADRLKPAFVLGISKGL